MTTSPNFLPRAFATLAALAVSAGFVLASPHASAQTAPARPAAEIRIDLKGQTPDAARKQIADAARDVCRETATNSPLLPRETAECRRATERQAIAQLGAAPVQLATR